MKVEKTWLMMIYTIHKKKGYQLVGNKIVRICYTLGFNVQLNEV